MDPQFVRRELERILASAAFSRADRSSRFLRFVVEHSLDGKNVEIKESTIAVELFDRKPAFDPKTDPIVRAEAARLRTRLDAYYRLEGCSDPVRISVPKGGYTPEFSVQAAEERPRAPRAPLLLIFAAFLALAAVAVVLGLRRPADTGGILRLSVLPPHGASIEAAVISPDGKRIAFTAVTGGEKKLWIRELDSLDPKALSGASFPFWSPDSHSLGFFAPK